EIISDGSISELTGNLLCVLTERGRMGCFGGIVKQFRILYNEHFKIAEITVTSSSPLSEQTRDKIMAKMSEVTGKTVSIKEKVDPSLIGGIVIDYGSTRYDGSVRTRLNGLKKELGGVIA
ncbi:MAG: ATP synthase F1 subunit delta, partial [Oscillospiraceae bacterium]